MLLAYLRKLHFMFFMTVVPRLLWRIGKAQSILCHARQSEISIAVHRWQYIWRHAQRCFIGSYFSLGLSQMMLLQALLTSLMQGHVMWDYSRHIAMRVFSQMCFTYKLSSTVFKAIGKRNILRITWLGYLHCVSAVKLPNLKHEIFLCLVRNLVYDSGFNYHFESSKRLLSFRCHRSYYASSRKLLVSADPFFFFFFFATNGKACTCHFAF